MEELLRDELEVLLEDEGTLLETNEEAALLKGKTCVEDELELSEELESEELRLLDKELELLELDEDRLLLDEESELDELPHAPSESP